MAVCLDIRLKDGHELSGTLVQESSDYFCIGRGESTVRVSKDRIDAIDGKPYVCGSVSGIFDELRNAQSTGYSDKLSFRAVEAFESENYDEAGALFEKAATSERVGPTPRMNVITDLLNRAGFAYRLAESSTRALEVFKQVLVIEEQAGRQIGAAQACLNIGIVYKEANRFHDALEYFVKAEAVAREHGQEQLLVVLQINIGSIFERWALYGKALSHYAIGLGVARSFNMTQECATLLRSMGGIYEMKGQLVQALGNYTQSLALERSLGQLARVGQDLRSIGEVCMRMANYSRAVECFVEAGTICADLSNTRNASSDNDYRLAVGEIAPWIVEGYAGLGDMQSAFREALRYAFWMSSGSWPDSAKACAEAVQALCPPKTVVLVLANGNRPDKILFIASSESFKGFSISDSEFVNQVMALHGMALGNLVSDAQQTALTRHRSLTAVTSKTVLPSHFEMILTYYQSILSTRTAAAVTTAKDIGVRLNDMYLNDIASLLRGKDHLIIYPVDSVSAQIPFEVLPNRAGEPLARRFTISWVESLRALELAAKGNGRR